MILKLEGLSVGGVMKVFITILLCAMSVYTINGNDSKRRMKLSLALETEVLQDANVFSPIGSPCQERRARSREFLSLVKDIVQCGNESEFISQCGKVHELCAKYSNYMSRFDFVEVDGEPQMGRVVVNEQIIGLLENVAQLQKWNSSVIPFKQTMSYSPVNKERSVQKQEDADALYSDVEPYELSPKKTLRALVDEGSTPVDDFDKGKLRELDDPGMLLRHQVLTKVAHFRRIDSSLRGKTSQQIPPIKDIKVVESEGSSCESDSVRKK